MRKPNPETTYLARRAARNGWRKVKNPSWMERHGWRFER
jgi:hypothetical protein